MELEEWRGIIDFNNYEISNLGRVKRVQTGVFLRSYIGTTGYRYFTLYALGYHKNKSLHRLIAEAFIPNPENKKTVNHKDGNRLNNNLDNLEWMTSSEQSTHKNKVLGTGPAWIGKKGSEHPLARPVYQIDKDSDRIIAVFGSMREAAEKIGLTEQGIGAVANNMYNRKTSGGFKWKFAEP
jgi:hypothetical protein